MCFAVVRFVSVFLFSVVAVVVVFVVVVAVVPDHMIGISNGLYVCEYSRWVVVVTFVIYFSFLLVNFMVISIFTCQWIPLVIYISSYSSKIIIK